MRSTSTKIEVEEYNYFTKQYFFKDFRKEDINIFYYDPLTLNGDNVTKLLLRLLRKMRRYHYNENLVRICNKINMKNIPQQNNNNDCGLFILKYAQYLINASEFNFSFQNMPYFRKRLIYELYSQNLLFP